MKKNVISIIGKYTAIIISICFLVLTFLDVLFPYTHKPVFLHQNAVIFRDELNTLFSNDDDLREQSLFIQYNNSNENRFEYKVFSENGKRVNYRGSASNKKYLFVHTVGPNYSSQHVIKKYDLSLNQIDKIEIDTNYSLEGIECNDEYIYAVICHKQTKECMLVKYSVDNCEEKSKTKIESNSFFADDDVALFIGKNYEVIERKEKTELFHEQRNKTKCLYNSDVEITFSTKTVNATIDGNAYSWTKTVNFNYFYEKAYLIDHFVVFGALQYSKSHECNSVINDICYCGLKESYLFVLDIEEKTLLLTKQLKRGSFLIDYDLDDVVYYYDGCLFNGDKMIRECEKISLDIAKRSLLPPHYFEEDASRVYRLAYYDGNVYGI